MSVYSPLKMLRYLSLLQEIDGGHLITVAPVHLEINPINACNHDCPFCTYRAQGDTRLNAHFNESEMLETEFVLRLLREAKELGVQAIQWCGGGEPTLHPGLLEMFAEATRLGLQQGLVTNGSRITEEWLPSLERFSWVRISMDAGTPETYQKTHASKNPLDFQRAWNTVRLCASLKRPSFRAQEELEVGVSFIVTPDNYREILDAVDLAKDAGASNIRIGAEVYTDGRPSALLPMESEILRFAEHAKTWETPDFRVHLSLNRIRNQSETAYTPPEKCWHHHLVGIVGADGWLYSCCIKKYCSDGRVVFLKDRSLREAFFGRERRDYALRLLPTRDCSHGCFLKPKNDLANIVFGRLPVKHEAFL